MFSTEKILYWLGLLRLVDTHSKEKIIKLIEAGALPFDLHASGKNVRIQHFFIAVVMSLIFGLGWVLAKAALEHFPPILLACFRFSITAAVLIGFAPLPRRHIKELLVISVLAITIPYSMSYAAMRELDVSSAVLLAQMESPILIMMGALLLREWPSLRQIFGIVIAVIGVAAIVGDPRLHEHPLAVTLAVGSIATWAVGQIRIRKLSEIGGMRILAWLSLFSAPQLLFLSALLEDGQSAALKYASLGSWLSVVYLGVIMTVLGIGIWYHLIGRYPVVQVSPFLLLVPIISIAGGAIFLGEDLVRQQVIGGSLVILGVATMVLQWGKKANGLDTTKALAR